MPARREVSRLIPKLRSVSRQDDGLGSSSDALLCYGAKQVRLLGCLQLKGGLVARSRAVRIGWFRPGAALFFLVSILACVVIFLSVSAGNKPSDGGASDSSTKPPASLAVCDDADGAICVANDVVSKHQTDLYPVARKIYEGLLKSDPGNQRAAAGLVRLSLAEAAASKDAAAKKERSQSSAQALKSQWEDWSKRNVAPVSELLPVSGGLLILLLVLSRLIAGSVVPPITSGTTKTHRRLIWSAGLGLTVLASAAPLLAASSRTPKPGVGWLIVAVVVALVVNVMTFTGPNDRRGWRRSELIVVTSSVLTIGYMALGTAFSEPAFRYGAMVAGVASAVVGVVLIALGRGLALGLLVQVLETSGEADVQAGRLLIARLEGLGSRRPRGLRVAEGADVTSLPEDALTNVPTGALATMIFNVVKVVRSATPWRLDVALSGEGEATVSVLRNGRPLPEASALISLDSPTGKIVSAEPDDESTSNTASPSDNDRLLTAAAAHVLVTMSERHPELSLGLCGATNWRSLSYYAISTREREPRARERLLEAAIDAAPEFLLARYGRVLLLESGTAPERKQFAHRLDALWGEFAHVLGTEDKRALTVPRPTDGYEAIQLRMLINRALAWTNVWCDAQAKRDELRNRAPLSVSEGAELEGAPYVEARAWRPAASAAVRLARRLRSADISQDDRLSVLVEQMRLPCSYLLLDLDAYGPSTVWLEPLGRFVKTELALEAAQVRRGDQGLLRPRNRFDFYAWACLHARRAPDLEHALEALQVACTDDGLRAWAPNDPSLRAFWGVEVVGGVVASPAQQEKFKQLVAPEPVEDYLDLPPFKAKANLLRDYGLTRLEQLPAVAAKDLARAAKVDPSLARSWSDIATLYSSAVLPNASDPARGLQILELLLLLDISDLPGLGAAMSKGADQLYKSLLEKARSLRLLPTRAETVDAWGYPSRRAW